ncbi:hypothetical protein ACJX0J_031986, partial [Zea mays]
NSHVQYFVGSVGFQKDETVVVRDYLGHVQAMKIAFVGLAAACCFATLIFVLQSSKFTCSCSREKTKLLKKRRGDDEIMHHIHILLSQLQDLFARDKVKELTLSWGKCLKMKEHVFLAYSGMSGTTTFQILRAK